MKKLLIIFCIVFFMCGCDMGTDSLTCTSTSVSNGLTTDTKYDIKYKDNDVKYVTITYDYNQDSSFSNTNDNTTANDGMNADTDGMTENDDNVLNDGNITSDEVVDGAVGDTIDGVVDGVKDTILDLAGIKSSYQNQFDSLNNIEGFSYDVDVDSDNEYKIVYKIDFDKISDSDLTRFNVDRNFDNIKASYEDLGYTCK